MTENLHNNGHVSNPEFWQPEVDSIKPEMSPTTNMNEDEGEEVKTLEDLQSSINRFLIGFGQILRRLLHLFLLINLTIKIRIWSLKCNQNPFNFNFNSKSLKSFLYFQFGSRHVMEHGSPKDSQQFHSLGFPSRKTETFKNFETGMCRFPEGEASVFGKRSQSSVGGSRQTFERMLRFNF